MWKKLLKNLGNKVKKFFGVEPKETKVTKPKKTRTQRPTTPSSTPDVDINPTIPVNVPARPRSNNASIPLTREERIRRLQEIQEERKRLATEEEEILKSLRENEEGPNKPRNEIVKDVEKEFKNKINYQVYDSNMDSFINYLQQNNTGKTFWQNFVTKENVWNLLLEKVNYEESLNNLTFAIIDYRNSGFINTKYLDFIDNQANILRNKFFQNNKVKLFFDDILNSNFENAITRLINLGIINDEEYDYEPAY